MTHAAGRPGIDHAGSSSGRRGHILLAACGALACGDLGFVGEVTGRRPFDPPPVYRTWWGETEACSDRVASFERVTWFVASGITGDGMLARARWSAPHEIIIVGGYEADEKVVRHEMLHDLLQGDRFHERTEWDGCGLRFEDTVSASAAAEDHFDPAVGRRPPGGHAAI